MASRIAGLGTAPRVPMPEADPAYWDQQRKDAQLADEKRKMANAAAVYEQQQKEIKLYGHTLDDPMGSRVTANTATGLGPIAAQRKAAGDLAPGVQPGSGDRKRMRPASAMERKRLKVAEAIDKPIQAVGKAIDYYGGPHVSDSLGRTGELVNNVAAATPGIGDAMQLGQSGSEYIDAWADNDKLAAWKAVGMGALGLGIFLPPGVKNAPMETLDEAKRLEKLGTPAEEIWQRTARDGKSGWWRAPDGQWRWELPDNESKITGAGSVYAADPRAMDKTLMPEKLPKLWKHDQLYEAQPEAMDAYASIANDGGGSGQFRSDIGPGGFVEAYGSPFNGGVDQFGRAVGEKNLRRILAHEGQHLVDYINDLPNGAMPGDDAFKFIQADDAARGLERPSFTQMGYGWSEPYRAYRRNSSENLASLTDKRLYMDMPTRVGQFPGAMMDYPADRQWIRDVDGSIRVPTGDIDLQTGDPTFRVLRGPQKGYKPRQAGSMEEAATPVAQNGPRRGRAPEASADELLQQAIDTPRKVSQRGGFVGAPPHISTPEAENALVADILTRLRAYKGQGTNFYDDFQNAIRNWTGNPTTAQKFATASGHTSNQMSPLPNTTHALKAMNQDAVGYPVKAGLYPNASGAKIADDFSTGRMSADPKTGQYTYHLLPEEFRPADFQDYAFGGERAVKPGRAVHDTWDKEATQFPRNPKNKQNAASDTEHLWMDRIYNKVVREARRDPELRGRLGTGSKTYERAQADLWDIERQKQEKFEVLPADKIMQENSALTQVAAIPGPSTGVDKALLNAPLSVKDQYTDQMMDAFSDGRGRNLPAASLGMTPPMEKGLGQWGDMMEPNRAVRYGVGTMGSGPDKVIDPASATAMGAVRDWNQIGLGQEGGAITVGRTDGATQATASLAPIGAPLKSYDDYERAFQAVKAHFGPEWFKSVVVQPGKNGEAVIKNIGDMPNKQFQQLAQKAGMDLSPGGTQIEPTTINKKGEQMFGPIVERDVGNDFRYVQFDQPGASPYVPDVFKQAPAFQNPDSYHRLFDDTRANPKLKGTFDRDIIPGLERVQAVSDRWEKDMGIPANTVIDRVRRIITEAGPSWPNAIDAAVKKGIIPAFAGAALLGGAAQSQFGNDGGVQ